MSAPPDLIRHRPALLQVATFGCPAWLRPFLCPEDLVHQTLLEACQTPERFAGMTAAQEFGYLRTALKNNLTDALRKYGRERMDVSPGAVADSSIRLGERFVADHTSPSVRAERIELLARLAVAMSALPDAQRVAVEMRYLRGSRVTDIARELNRSEGAVSLLIFRALAALRTVLTEANT